MNLLFGEAGAIGVLAVTLAPIVTVLVALRILLPLTWPAVALAALVVFVLSLSDLGVPMFLRVDVYPAAPGCCAPAVRRALRDRSSRLSRSFMWS